MVQDPAWRPWLGKPNTPDAAFVSGTNLEVLRAFFPDVAPCLKPELRLVTGPVASGKTRYREDACVGLVSVDPVDVYLALTDDGRSVPANIAELVQRVGEDVAALAVKERRSLAIEIVPIDALTSKVDDLVRAAKARRYTITMARLDVSNEEGKRRHEARPKHRISALDVQADALLWLMKAFYPGLAKQT